ncbi:ClpX C4-type zinc finger protein [Nocardioides conyzicola]|uniref:ClpX C4-type zinc finger protein n=1 Tax=Nocardioides conyzicola TaxID=1651781 RepID=A0ABP8X8D3_9ACTN
MDVDSSKKCCSFCGEQGQTGKPLVGGLGAFMCGDCVDYYKGMLDAVRDTGVVAPPPWETMSDADVLGKLSLITQTGDQVDAFLVEWVQLARSRKLSWAEVGKALGISRQAAWERFARSEVPAADAPDRQLGSA